MILVDSLGILKKLCCTAPDLSYPDYGKNISRGYSMMVFNARRVTGPKSTN